ncbi:hypothetical protein KY290_019304 [Solanum tuberosum]|uniref:Uncharacterized protein n=1 Tax=Solanum tuberosum TaxID=4113 RepID=A0ABQ7VGX6_SOLTU|nr:hypothetical protein KY284_018254 [Solanum tuberosum]KAH0763231.1 hypothetical protein KY290_019304 [Solanum tuberosum]
MHAFMFEFYVRSNWINCAAGIIGYCQHIKSFHLRDTCYCAIDGNDWTFDEI